VGRALRRLTFALALLTGCADVCRGAPNCAGTVLEGVDVGRRSDVDLVRLCVGELCDEARPRADGGGQGLRLRPPGTHAVGTEVEARVEFLRDGTVVETFTGRGQVEHDCGCNTVTFTVDQKRGVLRADD
jgi:hypothetical protein